MADTAREKQLREARLAEADLSDLERWALAQVSGDDHPAVSDSTVAVADQAQAKVDVLEANEIRRVFGR